MPFAVEQFTDKMRLVWRNPPANQDYSQAAAINYGPAIRAGLGTPGVPGLTYGRYMGPIWSPWLAVIPNANIFPAYTTPDSRFIARGAPAATGQGGGTASSKPGPGTGVLEIAPGEFV